MNGNKLIEKALEYPARTNNKREKYTAEHIELAIGWLRGNITTNQVGYAMLGHCIDREKKQMSSGNILYSLAILLKMAYEKKLIRIKDVELMSLVADEIYSFGCR